MDATDLIYNRFDIIWNEYEEIDVDLSMGNCRIMWHMDGKCCYINAWGKAIPAKVIDLLIETIETKEKSALCVCIQRTKENYNNLLVKGKEVVLELPDSEEELLARLTSKEQSHIRRYYRRLNDYGTIEIKLYRKDIPDDLVEAYFGWKKVTHGIDYEMGNKEYLATYHVTDAIAIVLSGRYIAALFWCQVNSTVYFENFSYDVEFEKYSPGFLIYTMFLKELINRGCKTVFLGGGGYYYKTKFGSIERDCYSGQIFTDYGRERIKALIQQHGWKNLAIWGLGNMGKAVLALFNELHVDISFAIDKEKRENGQIPVCSPDDLFPDSDMIFITIMRHNEAIENQLQEEKRRYMYWDAFLKEVLG